ncbi:hypothetical protein ACFSQJ_03920 [Croceitalea marina]|uniref:DUF559 domain-containing protein n=1 Tax=Croceitalea marina TaxID=1775166 RepID=A0ABW5MSU0_9FLAO
MHNDFRLYTSKQAFEIYNENCGDKKLFPKKSDMYFWCVTLGYKHAPNLIPSSLGPERQGEIHWGAFDDDIQKPFLNMVAVEANNSFDVLADNKEAQEKFRDIIQAYAELGFTLLCTNMNGHFTSDKLMEIIINETI